MFVWRGERVSEALIFPPTLLSLTLGGFHMVSSAVTWKYLSLPCDLQENGWRLSGTESRDRRTWPWHLELAGRPPDFKANAAYRGAGGGCCKCSPWLLLHLAATGFNVLKLLEDFTNLENL